MSFKCSIGFHDWVYDKKRRVHFVLNTIYLSSEDNKKYGIDSVNVAGPCGDRICARCSRIELNYTNAKTNALKESEDTRLKTDKARAKLDSFREISSEVSRL